MDHHADISGFDPGTDLAAGRKDLFRRLDDLRGLGLLPAWSETMHLQGEEAMQRLALSLVDLLESAQRRVIETSIQLLSLRELVAGLLNMRTPEEVAETVTIYLHKAFDHERVLVAVYDDESDSLTGWVAVRRGSPRCSGFRLERTWGGALREVLTREDPLRSWQDSGMMPLVDGDELPKPLDPFRSEAVGPYIAYPLIASQGRKRVMGVLAVARGFGAPTMDGMDAEILQSLVEAVSTAMENVMLDEDVRREEAFRKDVMGSMASGLVAVDLKGRVLTMNPRAEELTGYPLDEIKDSDTSRLGGNGEGLLRLLSRTLERRKGFLRRDTILKRGDGRTLAIACATTLLRNPAGEVYGALATFEDLTQIKTMEERIRQLDRLAALGRFTAGVAHEIRNPLAGIAAGVQYLAKHLDGIEGQEQNMGFIQREIERLNRIVEDLFQVTHPLPPRRSQERPRQLAELTVRCLGELPLEKGVTVTVDIDEALPSIPVDPDQIQQVLLNLIKNAIEATPRGGMVMVEASELRDEDHPQVEFRISDTGPGIDPEALPHIFEPFFTKGKAGGTGLGLYVSHGIAERHGGGLLAANADRGGAVFKLQLPLHTIEMTETV